MVQKKKKNTIWYKFTLDEHRFKGSSSLVFSIAINVLLPFCIHEIVNFGCPPPAHRTTFFTNVLVYTILQLNWLKDRLKMLGKESPA